MNKQHNDDTNPLHLGTEPELIEIESLLDALGQADREAMSEQTNIRALEAVSDVFVPAPISIDHQQAKSDALEHHSPLWKLRIAAGLLLVTGVTLSLIVIKPWASQQVVTPENNTGAWSLASFEQDLDAYLALEEVGDDSLDDAVANWELWAQTIDTDIDTELLGSGIGLTDLSDGAL